MTVRLVIQKLTNRGHKRERIPSCVSNFLLLSQRLHDDLRFSADPFDALEEFKVLLEKVKRLTIRELSRKTPDSIGSKLLIVSTALRVYRNRHLGTLMGCCVRHGSLLKIALIRFLLNMLTSSDSDRSSRFLLVKILRNAKLKSRISVGHRQKKTMLETDAEVDNVLGVTKKLVLSLSAVTNEEDHPWENEDESGRILCEYWGTFSKHVSKCRDIINLRIFNDLFEKLLTTSAGPLIRPSLTNSLL